MTYSSGLVFSLVVVMVGLIGSASAQTTHVVLDSIGWTIPQSGGASAYVTWAASKTFMVGDILVFNFANGRHNVVQVDKAAFDACTNTNAIGPVMATSPANITLDMAGEHYYICTFSDHCSLGQKLAINVTGSPSTAPPTGGPPLLTPPDMPTTPNSDSAASMLLVCVSLSVILLSLVATSIL